MNYAFQLTGLVTSDGARVDYSRFTSAALPALDESALDETAGIGTATEVAGYSTYFRCPSGRWRWHPVSGPTDWDCGGLALFANPIVSVDVNGDGKLTKLAGVNDWARIKFVGGEVGSYAGAALEPAAPPEPEAPVSELVQPAQALAGDTVPPTVKITGKRVARRRVTLRVSAVDAKAIGLLVVIVDGKKREIPATKARTQLSLKASFKKGVHRVAAGALDAVGNQSKTVRATTRVRAGLR
jgi:hypothetical protein